MFVVLGWFIVWRVFLVRFKFVRELVYGSSDDLSGRGKAGRLKRRAKEEEEEEGVKKEK